jgi:2-polyprenyl-6-methoxyphenol hydroxylase-like FAD-dependent oxidoreductase
MFGQIVYIDGEKVAQVDFATPADIPFGFIAIPQYATERSCVKNSPGTACRFERGLRVAGFEQDTDGVTVTLDGDTGAQTVRTGYLVGADGAHSTGRKGLGLTFEGAAFEEQYMLGDVEVDWSIPRGWAVRSMHRPTARPMTSWCAFHCPAAGATACRCSYPTTARPDRRLPTALRTASRGRGSRSCTTFRRCSTGCRAEPATARNLRWLSVFGSATASSTHTAEAGCSSRATPHTFIRWPARKG